VKLKSDARLRAGFALCIALNSGAVFAQTSPSQVTPDTVAPVRKSDTGVTLPETTRTAAPAGAESLMVKPARLEVLGADPAFATQIAQIVDPLAGQTVTVARIYQAAAEIEALYARSGRILTRATVPPQELRDGGVAQIRIIDGFIEAVDTSALPTKVRRAITARTRALIGKTGLTLPQIERRLLLAARVPGVSLQSTLVSGQKIGGAVLVLKADWKPVNALIGADNRLGNAYDTWNIDTQVVLNSAFGAGEQLYALGSTASDFDLFGGRPIRRILGAGAIVPLGTDGLTLNPEYIHADTNPIPGPGTVQTSGKLDHLALRLSYPLVLTRQQSLTITGSADLLDESQTIPSFATRLSNDKLRYLTLGLDWARQYAGTTVSAGASLSQGLSGLGARNPAAARASGVLLSRQGSEPDFTRFGGQVAVRSTVARNLQLGLTARGQASLSGALPASQQFSLDSTDGLSGFALGSVNADSGITGRAELSYVIERPGMALAPYLFGAAGAGNLSQPTVLERKNINGWSIGGGLRSELGKHVRASGELARSHSNVFTDNDTRLTVRVSFQF
jgi:hemolysin activation/secretion protein